MIIHSYEQFLSLMVSRKVTKGEGTGKVPDADRANLSQCDVLLRRSACRKEKRSGAGGFF